MPYYQYTPRGETVAKSDKPFPEVAGLLQAQSEIDYDLDFYDVTIGLVRDGVIQYVTKRVKPEAELIKLVKSVQEQINEIKSNA